MKGFYATAVMIVAVVIGLSVFVPQAFAQCEVKLGMIAPLSGPAAQWGIAHEQICAVGDDVNDIPMIRGAGLGVAMGNALAVVKAAADRIAPSHDEDGLAQVVEWLLGRE